MVGRKMLVVQPVDLKTLEASGSSFVALDGVGAGDTELVMVVEVALLAWLMGCPRHQRIGV